jgi:hypothetical protein
LLGCPGDSHQASQAWPLEDLADVVECDNQFLEPVKRSVVLPVQEDTAVLLGSDGPAGQLDLPTLGAEQGLDGGVESERQRGELGGGEGTLAALGLVLKTPRILRIFQITGLTKAFAAWPSVADAITADPHWLKTTESQAGSVDKRCRQHGLS